MKRLDAPAKRLDTDRYRPRDTNSPRAEFRPTRCPAHPGTRRPGPAVLCGRCVRRMNLSPDSVRVNGAVLGFCLDPARPGGGDDESVWHG
jgi:hypothetical protein